MISREDQDRDRAAAWDALGIDHAQAERDNCWLAPSVASHIDYLKRQIETLRTAVVTVRDNARGYGSKPGAVLRSTLMAIEATANGALGVVKP